MATVRHSISWQHLDISQPFGARWAVAACHCVTDCMHFIMAQQGFVIINYIDDFCGIAASEERTHAGSLLLKATLATLGLHEALDKSPPPPPPLVAGPGI